MRTEKRVVANGFDRQLRRRSASEDNEVEQFAVALSVERDVEGHDLHARADAGAIGYFQCVVAVE